MPVQLNSQAFTNGESIPVRFTCDGDDISPPLDWGEVPPPTKSLAIICDGPDAPSGVFVHWVLFDLSPTVTKLAEAMPTAETLPTGAKQGKNGFNRLGYGGPCPPVNVAHSYFFRLYALDSEIALPARQQRWACSGDRGSYSGAAVLMGTYQRQKNGSK